MARIKKTAKFTEDVLQEQPLDQTQTPSPTQATPEEVAQASLNTEDPTEELTIPEENIQEPQEPSQTPINDDPMFTPPAPGYVPAGWVKIEDLASAVALATGDTTPAETAPDVQDLSINPKEETASSNPSAAITEPLVQQPSQEPTTQQESNISSKPKLQEEIDLSCANDVEDSPSTGPSSLEEESTEEDKLNESKRFAEEEDVKANTPLVNEDEEATENVDEAPAPTSVSEGSDILENEDPEALNGDDFVEDDDYDNYELPEEIPMSEEDEDLLSKISSFLDDVKDEASEELQSAEDNIKDAADSFEDTSEFLRSLLIDEDDDLDEDTKDSADEGEDDLEMESPDDYDDLDEDEEYDLDDEDEEEDILGEDVYEESYRRGSRLREVSYTSFLPAGSEHFASTDNIVKSYEESSAARRRAIANFRASLKENRNRDSQLRRESSFSRNKFREALKGEELRESYGRSYNDEGSINSRSWGNNNTLNECKEKETLSWKELLNKGFLG